LPSLFSFIVVDDNFDSVSQVGSSVRLSFLLLISDSVATAGQETVREKILCGPGKDREFYLESTKIVILKKSQTKLKWNTADLIPLKAGRNILGHCDLNDVFS